MALIFSYTSKLNVIFSRCSASLFDDVQKFCKKRAALEVLKTTSFKN